MKLYLGLIKYHIINMYMRSGGITLPFFIAVQDEGEWSASHTVRFNPGERVPGTHWKGDWVGPRTGPDAVVTSIELVLISEDRDYFYRFGPTE
jgi:hypothetical protein